MFVAPGNPVKASEDHDPCGCITNEIYGAEKNKIVSDLLKSNEFKSVKKSQMENGYTLKGVNKIEVIYNVTFDFMMVGVPFTAGNGQIEMAVFFDGVYMDPELLKDHSIVEFNE